MGPTKLSIMSDLHLEFDRDFRPKNVHNADILILAGDISIFKFMKPESGYYDTFMPFFDHVSKEWPIVLYIAGNHEYYGHTDISSTILQDTAARLPDNIHLLHNDVFFYEDIVFVLGTMWTDMNKGHPLAILNWQGTMNDAKQIKDSKNQGYRITANSVLREHMLTKLFFKDTIKEYAGKKIVCVTHHAPSQLSEHPRYKGDVANCYYNSDLTELMADDVKLWVHGHTHDNFDYMIGNTRVVANPKGYRDENKKFDREFVLIL